jgi:hypothetical protein
MPARRDPSPLSPQAHARRSALNGIVGAAVVDAALLIALLWVAVVDRSDAAVRVVAPIFGFGYIYLLYLTAFGAMRGRWGLVVHGARGGHAGTGRGLRGRAPAARESEAGPAPGSPPRAGGQ